MNNKAVAFFIGRICLLLSMCMIPPAIIGYSEGDVAAGNAFILSLLALAAIGGVLSIFKGAPKNGIHAREGFVTVALGWIMISLFGALPFYLSGSVGSFIDCWFEAVSGITTTGASILSDVEILPKAVLYWRSFLNWLGGMGVLVFMLAIVPMAKGSGESLFILRAESPGPVISKLVPKTRQSVRILYLIYTALTVLLFLLLFAGGMPLFDSICHAFSTAGTGGFSIKNNSIGAYDSYYLQTVISIFMMLYGINFSIFYLLLIRDFKSVLKSEELRLYLGIIAVAVLMISLDTRSYYPTLYDTVHHAYFQTSAIITTTGFSSVNFDLWPQLSRTVLILLMVFGACAGSTGGGLKLSRLLILCKSARHELQKMLHPRSIKVMKLDGKALDGSVVTGVFGYFVLYCIVIALSTLAVALSSPDFTTTFSAVISCVNNIGPGLNAVGPTSNYLVFSDFGRIVLSLDMLIGRLEIYPMLLLFSPSTWRRGI